jgi:hypothetical protein
METYLKLMQNPVEMKDLFFTYLKSRVEHCRRSLFSAIKRGCEITSTTNGFVWEDGHFGFNSYQAMIRMSIRIYDAWPEVKQDLDYPLVLNQVVKEINRVNGPHDHFLAFFELYTHITCNNRK